MDCYFKKGTLLCLFLQLIITFIDETYSVQIATNCANNQYYDANIYDCLYCPLNMVPRIDGKI